MVALILTLALVGGSAPAAAVSSAPQPVLLLPLAQSPGGGDTGGTSTPPPATTPPAPSGGLVGSLLDAVKQAILDFYLYAKDLVMQAAYTVALAALNAIPHEWADTIDAGMAGATTLFQAVDIFAPLGFMVACVSACLAFTLAFWFLKFLCRIELLGFKLGG